MYIFLDYEQSNKFIGFTMMYFFLFCVSGDTFNTWKIQSVKLDLVWNVESQKSTALFKIYRKKIIKIWECLSDTIF